MIISASNTTSLTPIMLQQIININTQIFQSKKIGFSSIQLRNKMHNSLSPHNVISKFSI